MPRSGKGNGVMCERGREELSSGRTLYVCDNGSSYSYLFRVIQLAKSYTSSTYPLEDHVT